MAIRRAAEELVAAGAPRAKLRALVDLSELGVQTQDGLTLYKQRLGDPGRQPGRLATIVSSALVRRQIERTDMPNQRIFPDEERALAWLLH